MEREERFVKVMTGVCCLQELRWRGLCSRMLGMDEMRYTRWWSGK